MSKKKACNTMTLKDFHGGSIPSDLPLPSAPGVVVRPVDRPGFERPNAWGNPMGRPDNRLRPSSSGSMRNLDDKTPFLSNTVHIGRNFDEDERKPLDGGSNTPRRTVSDDTIRGPVGRAESKGDSGRFVGQPVVGQVGGGGGNSYSAMVVEGGHSSVGSRPLSGGGSYPNAWGVRKEPSVAVAEMGVSPWSGQSTVTKFAQASALDQISSGRWQTKPVQHQVDIEVIRQSESPNGLYGSGRESDFYGGGVNFGSEREQYENTLVRHAERGLVLEEGIRVGVKEMSGVERVRSPVLSDGNDRSSVLYTNDGQPAYPDGKYGGSEAQLPPEVSERPKLKLLPRTRPLDAPEPSAVDYKQPADTIHSGIGANIHGNAIHMKPVVRSSDASHVKRGSSEASHMKPGSSETSHMRPGSNEANHVKLGSNEASRVKPAPSSIEAENRHVERPKLNLKPRSQPIGKSGVTEIERKAVFGGARPREMVLKERGVEDVIKTHDEMQVPSRIKSEITPTHANSPRHMERIENLPIDHRTGRGNEKRDQRADIQKTDMPRKNWRNENWRNNRDTEKHHQQERQPSPETWRKPVEQPKPANSDSSGLRFGKAVSAVDLAQAFSRSKSEPKSADQFSGQRALPGRTQVPFSRLTAGPATRPQINGY